MNMPKHGPNAMRYIVDDLKRFNVIYPLGPTSILASQTWQFGNDPSWANVVRIYEDDYV
jgi:hypothetical protein